MSLAQNPPEVQNKVQLGGSASGISLSPKKQKKVKEVQTCIGNLWNPLLWNGRRHFLLNISMKTLCSVYVFRGHSCTAGLNFLFINSLQRTFHRPSFIHWNVNDVKSIQSKIDQQRTGPHYCLWSIPPLLTSQEPAVPDTVPCRSHPRSPGTNSP